VFRPQAESFVKQSFKVDTEQLAGVGQLAFSGLGLFVDSDEAREGIATFAEKRPPDFAALPGPRLDLSYGLDLAPLLNRKIHRPLSRSLASTSGSVLPCCGWTSTPQKLLPPSAM
jgi:hypothetical protein